MPSTAAAEPDVALAPEETVRYARNLSLPEIGEAGQARIRAGSVLVVGVGGLGSAAAFYLCAAGIGRLGLADFDVVDVGNLQRQILHTTDAVGRFKVDSAEERLRALNPHVRLEPVRARLDGPTAGPLFENYDVVISATDTFASKAMVADVCACTGTPYVHGGISGFRGELLTVRPGRSTCYRCLCDAAPEETGKPRGPLGPVAGAIGTLQALEALKLVGAFGTPYLDRWLEFDGLAGTFRAVPVRRNPACPACSWSR